MLIFLLLIASIAPALSDEWTSRSGQCFEWQGLWTVERDQSGVWVGSIDYQQIGGPCIAGDNSIATSEVRAVIVGEDFFARVITGGSASCLMHGRVRGVEVRGFSLCTGAMQSLAFALQLRRM
jgi:hypothetical protein